MLTLTQEQLPAVLLDLARTNLVPFIQGDPGTAKSNIIAQFADKHNLHLVDIRLSQLDPTELNGFPVIDGDRMKYAPLRVIPLDGDTIPDNKNGTIILFDEFNSAPRSVQAAAYKIVLDRFIGEYPIHKNCFIICAGNLSTNKAITNNLSTAMQSRLVHIEMSVSSSAWLSWANKNNIDSRVISFIKYRPNLLHNFDPNHHDKTFPCMRTWEFTSKYISNKTDMSHTNLVVIAGCVGEGAATEFNSYLKVYSKLPSIADIIADPEGIAIKDEPSHYFAYTTLISRSFGLHPDELILFVNRLPIEFQVITLREAIELDQSVSHFDCVAEWCTKNGKVLY